MIIGDGAIAWRQGEPKPAAEGFDMEARRHSIYEWVRQIRGGVLGGVFTIERQLSASITYFMLGDRIRRGKVQMAFIEGLLDPLTFERRTNVAKQIASEFMTEDASKDFGSKLNRLRTIRNSMAHKPFWFEAELNDAGEVFNLVPRIQVGRGTVALTTAYVDVLNSLISELIDLSSQLTVSVSERELDEKQP